MAENGFKSLFENFATSGRVEYIGVRPGRREAVIVKEKVEAIAGRGLEGDRYRNKGQRQVTLIQWEHIQAVASLLGAGVVNPSLLRRNIVVSGINLLAFKGKRFQIGQAVLEYTGECHPCSRMEENLGKGGYNAMRGHGGITAKIIEPGEIRVGDLVAPIIN